LVQCPLYLKVFLGYDVNKLIHTFVIARTLPTAFYCEGPKLIY